MAGGPTELATLYGEIRNLSNAQLKAIGRAGKRRRGVVGWLAMIIGVEPAYRRWRRDPWQLAQDRARAALRTAGRRPPNLQRPINRSLGLIGLATIVADAAATVVLVWVMTAMYPGGWDRADVADVAVIVAMGIASATAAGVAEALRRRSLRQ